MTPTTPLSLEIIDSFISVALDILYEKDAALLVSNVGERCIVFKFAKYFEQILTKRGYLSNGLSLDVEYNHHLNETKTMRQRPKGSAPDLIIHQRGNDGRNILVLEAKKASASKSKIQKDEGKIKDYRREYGYAFGVMLIFGKNRNSTNFKFIPTDPTDEEVLFDRWWKEIQEERRAWNAMKERWEYERWESDF